MQKSSFVKSGFVISFMTFVSRVFGLIRDVVIAKYFGASTGSDAFFVAFRIPNFLRRLFAEGAFSQAFVPILSHSRINDNAHQTQILINHIGAYLLKVLFITTVVAIIIAPLIILIFAFGFYTDSVKFNLASDMLRITFPYLLFISLTAFFGAILNVHNRFGVVAFTPVLLNISLILSALYLGDYLEMPIMALPIGVFLGGIAQFLWQIPFLKKIDALPDIRFVLRKNKHHPAIAKLKRKMLPAMFGVSIAQINLLIDTLIASFLITGSISWLYYADRLLELPLALIGISLATLSLTKLSAHIASSDTQSFKNTIDKALSLAIILGLPASTSLIILAQPLIITLFQYDSFTVLDGINSAYALMAYAAGLLMLIFVKILAPAFYALGNIKTPVKIGVVAMLVNIVFNLILVWFLAHIGLALATSISASVQAFLLFFILKKQGHYQISKGLKRLSIQVLIATLAMAIYLVFINSFLGSYINLDLLIRIFYLSVSIIPAIIMYFLILLIFNKYYENSTLYKT